MHVIHKPPFLRCEDETGARWNLSVACRCFSLRCSKICSLNFCSFSSSSFHFSSRALVKITTAFNKNNCHEIIIYLFYSYFFVYIIPLSKAARIHTKNQAQVSKWILLYKQQTCESVRSH